MRKLFASLVVICMLASGMTAFAADEPASADDKIIEHEAQGEVMPIAETEAEVPAAEGEEAVVEGEAVEGETAEDANTEAETTEGEEAKAETAEDAEKTEATEEAEEAEKVEIDAESMAKNIMVINGEKLEIAEDMGAIAVKDGIIYIPVRAALEFLGYQVSWAEKEQMVMGANQTTGAMFIMQLDNPLLFYLTESKEEGKTIMEASPFKNEEEWRTYVPLGGLAKALGMKIAYDAEAALLSLSK